MTDRKTKRVWLYDYYMTVFLDKSGGYFHRDPEGLHPEPLIEIEPDEMRRQVANGQFQSFLEGYIG